LHYMRNSLVHKGKVVPEKKSPGWKKTVRTKREAKPTAAAVLEVYKNFERKRRHWSDRVEGGT